MLTSTSPIVFSLAACLVTAFPALGQDEPPKDAPLSRYSRWKNGPNRSADYFPIGVWLQQPRHAKAYKKAGINLYVGLWKGPTEAQLARLAAAGMPVVCHQNDLALESKHNRIIVGWMHGDEPDNAQRLPGGKGWGPPVPPRDVVAAYRRIVSRDPTRPVLLQLGQGVAHDKWRGRGTRTNHPEDYAKYIVGSDVVSFDIYPVVHPYPTVAGKLWYVPLGVSRLVTWTNGEKPVWNCIEASRIQDTEEKATPAQVRAEVWMSIIHGSRGLIYFVHQFRPKFDEASLLHDPKLLSGITAINLQIHELAPIINAEPIADRVDIRSSVEAVPIAFTVREHGGKLYVFAVAMREGRTEATIRINDARRGGTGRSGTVTLLGEDRSIPLRDGSFRVTFEADYAVHLFRIDR